MTSPDSSSGAVPVPEATAEETAADAGDRVAGERPATSQPGRWYNAATPAQPSDTVGTGSVVAIGCSVLMLLLVFLGVAIFLLLRLF